MFKAVNPKNHRLFWLRRVVTFSVLLTALVCAISFSGAAADAIYILTGVENTAVVLTKDARVSAISNKFVYLDRSGTSYEAVLTAGQNVTVRHNGEEITAVSRNERVSSLLNRLRVDMTPLEMVSVDVSNPDSVVITVSEDITYYDKQTEPAAYEVIRKPTEDLPEDTEKVIQNGQNGERISVYEVVWSAGEEVSRQLVEEVANTSIPEIVEYSIADHNLDEAVNQAIRAAEAAAAAREYVNSIDVDAAWEEATKAAEAADAAAIAAEATREIRAAEAARAAEEAAQSSVEASKAARDAEAAKAAKEAEEARKAAEAAAAANKNLPMDKLVDVRKNSDGSGTLVFASGRTQHYRYAKNMTATAYNCNEPGLNIWTATGTKCHKGVVAVDRRVIPLGTTMYVVAKGYEYGYSRAEDTGVSGNIIDLYFESYSGMVNFGRRSCVCYIF